MAKCNDVLRAGMMVHRACFVTNLNKHLSYPHNNCKLNAIWGSRGNFGVLVAEGVLGILGGHSMFLTIWVKCIIHNKFNNHNTLTIFGEAK